LAWMSFATLLPLGLLQLYHSVSAGYVEARSFQFLSTGTAVLIEWMRLPGDLVFIAGTLPILWLTWTAIRHRKRIPESHGESAARVVEVSSPETLSSAGGPAIGKAPTTRE